jgi:3'(2'), 5'-bisphosphate nucleotidase
VNYDQEKHIAIAAVTAAAKLCQRVRQARATGTLEKEDASPVTVADFASQAVICQALVAAFADDPIVAEEDAALLQKPEFAETLVQVTDQVKQFIPGALPLEAIAWINRGKGKLAPRYWTLDPIDGTKGFLRGDQYAIALALVEAGQVKLGILGCPALPLDFTQPDGDRGVLFVAVQGQGTVQMSLDGAAVQSVRVQHSETIGQLRRIESVESTHSDRDRQAQLDRALQLVQAAIPMDSQAKYGAIARAEADLYLRIPLPQYRGRSENIWDHAAGAIVVQEAGGKVTDLDGKPLDFSVGSKLSRNRGILASNGSFHEQVLAAAAIAI